MLSRLSGKINKLTSKLVNPFGISMNIRPSCSMTWSLLPVKSRRKIGRGWQESVTVYGLHSFDKYIGAGYKWIPPNIYLGLKLSLQSVDSRHSLYWLEDGSVHHTIWGFKKCFYFPNLALHLPMNYSCLHWRLSSFELTSNKEWMNGSLTSGSKPEISMKPSWFCHPSTHWR